MSDSSNENVHGLGGTLFWGLLVAALAVAGTAFYFLSDRALPPARGFGGPNSDRGFPYQIGNFALDGVKEVAASASDERHLVATYSLPGSAPLSFKYYGFPDVPSAGEWLRLLREELTRGTYREERRGTVEEKVMEGDKPTLAKFGDYFIVKGTVPGQPVQIAWTQDNSGFVISAPTVASALELRGLFKLAEGTPPQQ